MRPAAGNAGTRDATNALTRWLTADAIVTGLNAAAYLALAGWLTTLLGSGDGVLRGIGVFLMAFTVLVLVASVTRSTALAVVVVATNVVWVVASVIVGATGLLDLADLGRGWMLLQAVVVAAFAVLQPRALRAGGTPATGPLPGNTDARREPMGWVGPP